MEETPHILVVDDHRDIRDALGQYLKKTGHRVALAENAADARKVLAERAIDLVVLDIMMPGEDGLALCRWLRGHGEIPVILLTALDEETDRIVGLEVGADDYVTKPFNPRELLARIKAVLRRTHSLPPGRAERLSGSAVGEGDAARRLAFDRWTLDLDRRELVDSDGVSVTLTTGEFLLLAALLQHPGRVMTRDQLLDLTRGREAGPFERAVDNQISRLRRKIEVDPKQPAIIKTHWGGGYQLAVPVRDPDTADAPAGGAP